MEGVEAGRLRDTKEDYANHVETHACSRAGAMQDWVGGSGVKACMNGRKACLAPLPRWQCRRVGCPNPAEEHGERTKEWMWVCERMKACMHQRGKPVRPCCQASSAATSDAHSLPMAAAPSSCAVQLTLLCADHRHRTHTPSHACLSTYTLHTHHTLPSPWL